MNAWLDHALNYLKTDTHAFLRCGLMVAPPQLSLKTLAWHAQRLRGYFVRPALTLCLASGAGAAQTLISGVVVGLNITVVTWLSMSRVIASGRRWLVSRDIITVNQRYMSLSTA
jgi:hypothetical protein